MTPLALPLSAADAVDKSVLVAMQNFLASPTIAHQYSGSRRLEASGSGQRAWLDVQTDFTLASGLLYEVTAEGGSGYIRARVLRSLLDEEQKLIARGGSAEHRDFGRQLPVHAGGIRRGRPGGRRYHAAAQGPVPHHWTDVPDRPMAIWCASRDDSRKNPSFWVTRVNVVRSYRRINGVLMPVSLDTTAQLRLLGSSALRMTYRYSQINHLPVDHEQLEQPEASVEGITMYRDHGIHRRAVDEPAPAPSQCPQCGSPTVKTTSKVVTSSSYWRCEACGEIWNADRRIAASRYVR